MLFVLSVLSVLSVLIRNTYVRPSPFFTLGPVSTTLYSMHTVRHLYISAPYPLQHIYNTLQDSAKKPSESYTTKS